GRPGEGLSTSVRHGRNGVCTGSRDPGSAKYTGGMQSPQSVVLCSDFVESEQTRVDAQIGPGSLVMKGSGVRVSPAALREVPAKQSFPSRAEDAAAVRSTWA